MLKLSVIIVNYNTAELTVDCIASVLKSRMDSEYEIILVDNASSDGTVARVREQFPQVRVIVNEDNLGFAKANNIGIKVAQGEHILLLNSDTLVETNTLDYMAKFMDENPKVGAAGCKVLLPDGRLDKACKRGFPTPSASFYYAFGFAKLFPKVKRFNQYQLGYLSPDEKYPVDCLVGAFMMVRRETINQVGLLDEEFFMYGEDIDWCYRMKQAGWEIYYNPAVKILHLKGASSRKKPKKIIYEFHRAMILFHRKHYKNKYPALVNGLVYAGVGTKYLMSLMLNRFGSVR
ncbi:glycosyltransferase family 2 protein [Paenibacillus gansuensis]|uniref:Glycosyltransferase family 2 protein n=1 Tax=Paenibacillus gansuensis TaxID=306542 RepID=A0ABW5PH40_9BACL